MTFQDYQNEIHIKNAALQEATSSVYAVVPCADFRFICFYDLECHGMRTTVSDANFVEIKLLEDVPPEIIIEYGKFITVLREWTEGNIEEFPFSNHTGENAVANISG